VSAKPHTEVAVSELPDCDLCSERGLKRPAQFDGRMRSGVWAYLCQEHFMASGVGLGLGNGQRLVVK
jgi:hypothetical protein